MMDLSLAASRVILPTVFSVNGLSPSTPFSTESQNVRRSLWEAASD